MGSTRNNPGKSLLRHAMLAVLLCGLCLGPAMAEAELAGAQSKSLSDLLEAVDDQVVADPDAAWHRLEDLREQAESAQDQALWADWNNIAANTRLALGEIEEAARHVAVSLSVYRQIGSLRGELESIQIRADLLSTQGRFGEAIEQYTIVLGSLGQLEGQGTDDPRYVAATAHNGLGDAYTVIGDSATALEHVLAAYELFSALGDDEAVSGTLVLLGNIYSDIDAVEEAIESYQGALALDRKNGDEYNVAVDLYNIARAFTDQGDYQRAANFYDQASEIALRLELSGIQGHIHYGRGLSLYGQKKWDQAGQSFNQAARMLAAASDQYMVARARLHLALIATRQSQPEVSNRLLQQALPPFESTDSGRDLVEVHALFAENYAALGQYQMAYEHETTRSDQMKQQASKQRANRTAQLRVRFESAKAEAENQALSEENELKQQQLEAEKFYNLVILGFVFVLLLVAVALSYSIWRQKQLEQKLKMLANTDDLTGLLNRRHLFELGRVELVRAIRYQQEMSLLVLDLDYFKSVNDQYGHATGDDVLRAVAKYLAAEMRDIDVLGRVGGEEFVVVLPHTSSEEADAAARRLTTGLSKLDLKESCKVAEPITMSIGVAWLQGKGDTFQLIINRADAALYEAKAAGRNTVRSQSGTSTG